jgi:tRNA A-37 threonylcarbamoyl transferase component Bud32
LKALPAAPTADFVRHTIIRELIPRSRGGAGWRIDASATSRRCSVFRAEGTGAPWPLAIKIYQSDIGRSLVTRQARMLASSKDHMRRAEFTVPALFGVSRLRRAVLMEWIDAPTIGKLLAAAGHDRARRSELFAVAGSWLREFHRQPQAAAARLDINAIVGLPATAFGGDRNALRKIRDGDFQRALGVLKQAARLIGKAKITHTICHGDFTPNNLMHGGGRTIGIDLAANSYGPVTTDICRFLVRAETAKRFISWSSKLSDLGIERTDLHAFLNAYESDSRKLDRRVLALCLLAEVVHRWATIFARPKAPHHIGRWVKHHRMRRMARMAGKTVLRRIEEANAKARDQTQSASVDQRAEPVPGRFEGAETPE